MPASAPARRRLPPEDRKRQILEAAVDFFAERGFSADTRRLAQRLGVSHSLIFRYFPSKSALIEAVFRRVFLDRWNAEWETILRDPNRPLAERLADFYRAYLEVADDPRWVRIVLRASLDGRDLTRRYVSRYVSPLLAVLAGELRKEAGLPEARPGPEEMELAWALHSAVIYALLRKHVHRLPPALPHDRLLALLIQAYLEGALAAVAQAAPAQDAARRRLGLAATG
ncbi:MAG: helix-turn-helix domain-containing protein [Rhodovarius sp.]|nr:TetR/AcrR family transcriptional regulator [Rhodovarius sp.]MCX7932610.1 TetR/AcrR family transcriptional regulator [Rhodovarius sp.]MDW8313878.1 helix-turn-helix domain-containing protein [Rhodovarius sp.]